MKASTHQSTSLSHTSTGSTTGMNGNFAEEPFRWPTSASAKLHQCRRTSLTTAETTRLKSIYQRQKRPRQASTQAQRWTDRASIMSACVTLELNKMAEATEDLIQMLDEQGQLENIRAQIRAKVLNALHQAGRLPNQEIPLHMNTETGRIVAELFRDYLMCNGLVSTLHVFEPECQLVQQGDQIKQVSQKLGLTVKRGVPLIYQLVDPLIEVKPKLSDSKGPSQQPKQQLTPKLDIRAATAADRPGLGGKPLLELDHPDSDSPDIVSSLGSNEFLAGALRPRTKNVLPKLAEPALSIKTKPNKDQYQDEISRMLAGKKIPSPYDDDIDEEIDDHFEEPLESTSNRQLVESNGTSSLGADASVDSLALDEYDHVEEVRRSRSKFKY
mmetsp:Transcript_9817/g.19341  ORF Transcript_9817/g.19341 Transcript_9817/m.19341 type:complete len:385 (+) Transcript_9817:2851-4005(+)